MLCSICEHKESSYHSVLLHLMWAGTVQYTFYQDCFTESSQQQCGTGKIIIDSGRYHWVAFR